jgi:hypothetical protein
MFGFSKVLLAKHGKADKNFCTKLHAMSKSKNLNTRASVSFSHSGTTKTV